MKIKDIQLVLFNNKVWLANCRDGHLHPGPEANKTVAMLKIITESGHEGYHFSNYNHYVPNEKYEIPQNKDLYFYTSDPNEINKSHPWQLLLWIVKPIILGEDALCREKIFLMMTRIQRMYSALTDPLIAAIDLALWDLAGRYFNQPVYKLMGGYRTRLKAYASTMVGDTFTGGLSTEEEFADFAELCKAQGYQAYKLHTWANNTWDDKTISAIPDWKRDVKACHAVRERVGESMDLMIDPYHYYDKEDAYCLGKALEKLNYVWLEEPMDEYEVSSYQWLCEKLDIPVLGPELFKGKYYSRAEWIRNKVSDICRAGVNDVGGLTGLIKVINLCQASSVRLELHYGPATTHAMSIMTYPGEYYERGMLHPFLDYETAPPFLNQSVEPLDEEGYVVIPDIPGIGWDINWDYIKDNYIIQYG